MVNLGTHVVKKSVEVWGQFGITNQPRCVVNLGTHQDKEYKFWLQFCLEKDNGAQGRTIDRIDKAESKTKVW